MKKVLNVIDDFVKYFLVLMVAAISILGMYQVVGRIFGRVPAWVEELIRFLFVWASCVGAAIGVKEHIHIGVDVIVNLFPKILQRIIAIAVQVVLCGFDCFLIKFGFQLVKQTMKQKSAGLQIPMGYVYVAVPVLGILGIFYSVREIIRLAKGEEKGEGELPIA